MRKLELPHPPPSGAWWKEAREALANYSTVEIEDFLRAKIAEDVKRNLYELAEGPCDETNPAAVRVRDWARAEYRLRYSPPR